MRWCVLLGVGLVQRIMLSLHVRGMKEFIVGGNIGAGVVLMRSLEVKVLSCVDNVIKISVVVGMNVCREILSRRKYV